LQNADWLTTLGISVGAIGLFFTWYGIHRTNKNASAASYISLNEAWRQAWERYLAAVDEPAKQHQFAELSNILEISCALKIKKVFTGVSRELLTEYIDDIINLLRKNEDARNRLLALIDKASTFKYVRLYLDDMRKRSPD
jgi:hypothetical protein